MQITNFWLYPYIKPHNPVILDQNWLIYPTAISYNKHYITCTHKFHEQFRLKITYIYLLNYLVLKRYYKKEKEIQVVFLFGWCTFIFDLYICFKTKRCLLETPCNSCSRLKKKNQIYTFLGYNKCKVFFEKKYEEMW